jgi:hypothetical protein
MSAVRWNIAVSQDTDQSVRLFLAEQGKSRKGALSNFIEESVRAHILELSAEQTKAENAGINESELASVVSEAIQWAREQCGPRNL